MKKLLISTFLVFTTYTAPLHAQFDSTPTNSQASQATWNFQNIQHIFPNAQQGGSAKIKDYATLQLHDDLILLNGDDGAKLLNSWGNLTPKLDGLIIPSNDAWSISFLFQPLGYISEKSAADLDPKAILTNIQQAQEQANKTRLQNGLDTLKLSKWVIEPNYDAKQHKLEWAVLLEDSAGDVSINYEMRQLGRKGIISATLLCSSEKFATLKDTFKSTLDSFNFTPENRYEAYKDGDESSALTLTELITGNENSGFSIKNYWKPLAIGGVLLILFINLFFTSSSTKENSAKEETEE